MIVAKELTGRKVFLITAAAFGVIIAVNFTMAYKAVSTFPGLEVKNSYVASQNFDKDRAAQLALGWDVSAVVADGNLVLSIRDASGNPVEAAELSGTFGRATSVVDDQEPVFTFDGQNYVAPVRTAKGNWNLRMVALAEDGTEFKQRVVIYVKE